jgi:hypothetical protein
MVTLQEIIMKRLYSYFLALILTSCSISLYGAIELIGIGNYFEDLRTASQDKPTITYSGKTMDGKEVKDKPVSAVYRGGLQLTNMTLPITIDVKYNNRNKGQPYRLMIEEVTDPNQRLACQGRSSTVRGSRADINVQKVCVPQTISTLPTSITGIKSGDFSSIALLIGPLGVKDKYNPQDTTSLPFRFGLMAWSTTKIPWNTTTVAQTYDDYNYTFSSPLRVFQGFSGLGGGTIPRQFFGSINHIYNDTDYILIISRSSTKTAELATYNITQVIPPRSVLPYALVWIPKIDKTELNIPSHDGIRIAALMKAQTAPPPDAISHSEIADLTIPSGVPLPEDFSAFLKEIDETGASKITNDAAELLGIQAWDEEIKSSYEDFDASHYYYTVATTDADKKTVVQKCSIKTSVCSAEQQLTTPAFSNSGIPNYYNMIAHLDEKGEFSVSLYPTKLVPPRDNK